MTILQDVEKVTPSTLRRARFATAGLFFLDGLTFATWVTRIPVIQEKLSLSNAVLGFALLAVSVGALVSMPIAGKLVARFGSRSVSAIAVAFFGAGLFFCRVSRRGSYRSVWR